MSTFSCPVARVASVIDHPGADRLSILTLEGMGFTCISAKLEDGSPRYAVGDLVVYIPSAAVLPEWLLREMDFWNEDLGKGTLAGSQGDRVKPMRLRGVFSDGVLYQVLAYGKDEFLTSDPALAVDFHVETPGGEHVVSLGQDVSDLLGITKYEPPIPAAMAGEVANMMEHLIKYDFERIERVLDMFEPGESVTATEKLHGTNMCITWVPDLTHEEMFGTQGNIMVNSKGLGASGLAFKNNPANQGNLYVRTLRDLLSNGFEQKLVSLVGMLTQPKQLEITTSLPVRIWGEVFGQGVQDLHYGTKAPEFAVFDILIGERWLTDAELEQACVHLGVRKVPLAYKGPFDLTALEAVRDGATLLGGANIREGIVVRSENLLPHPVHGRRIAKMISPDYLVRKAKNATEFQ
jgi:RNA ligase (TIGR02306 family)